MDVDTLETSSPPKLTFDPEWLAVIRTFDPYMVLTQNQHGSYPEPQTAAEAVSRELEWVKQNLPQGGHQDINNIQTFAMTATGPTSETQRAKRQQRAVLVFSKLMRMLTCRQPVIFRTPRRPHYVPCYRLTTRSIV